MIVSLDNIWCSELLFNPARDAQGKLLGLEIVVNFIGIDPDVRTPAERVLPRLTSQQAVALFTEQLELIDAYQLFFIQHHLIAWININPLIASALMMDEKLAASVKRFPFIEFTINEDYPQLNRGNENPLLVQLANRYSLVLANFGAGAASTRAIFDGLFTRIALDKHFVNQRLSARSFQPFMQAIVTQIKPYCRSMMIAGIDSEQTLKRVAPFSFSAMQGRLWPPVPPQQVTQLVQG
ncbi:EAL domain-containing protein [Pseudescherichia sp.]|uniref:EAL domain-containing protein n=1 Tax=Pseudescherichia sp. TaxID=2055881 RepID=UPI00289A69F2|nr:EAL domain-containing protein [Pseudescherichia sp.]